MRNYWFPKYQAEYMTAQRFKEMGLTEAAIGVRDRTFGTKLVLDHGDNNNNNNKKAETDDPSSSREPKKPKKETMLLPVSLFLRTHTPSNIIITMLPRYML